MRKKIQGSFTIEAAVIVPFILFIFGILLHILFYWHDKNVLMNIGYETAVLGSGRNQLESEELESYFLLRVRGKLLLLETVQCDVYMEDDEVTVICGGRKDFTSVKEKYKMSRTEPEQYIRNIRKLEKLGEGIGK